MLQSGASEAQQFPQGCSCPTGHELVSDAHVYDATNPEARDIYWNNLPGKLLAQGWDSFWLDSAEPEEYWPHMGDAILSSRQTRHR